VPKLAQRGGSGATFALSRWYVTTFAFIPTRAVTGQAFGIGTGVPGDSDRGIRVVDDVDPLTALGMRSLVWHAVPPAEGIASFVVVLGTTERRTSFPASWAGAGGGVWRVAQPARSASMSRAGRCMRDLREGFIARIYRSYSGSPGRADIRASRRKPAALAASTHAFMMADTMPNAA
jgi:hypothetical protein